MSSATPTYPASVVPISTGTYRAETAQKLSLAATAQGGAWYLVHTKPRQEHIALANLERQGYHCYLPLLNIQKIRRRVAAVVSEAMFPRYLFIRLESGIHAKSWSPIRSTLGVNQLVHFGAQPARIDEQLIALLREREQQQTVEPLFHEGDAVVITDGPFAGIEAVFRNTDAEQRSIILLELLSKQVSLHIEAGRLRRVG